MSLQQNPVGGGKAALLTGGLAVLLVGVFAAGGLVVRTVKPTAAPVAAGATTTAPTTTAPTAPPVMPSRNPRRQPDVDRGTPVDQGVYVEISDGWTTDNSFTYRLDLSSEDRGGAFVLEVQDRAMPSSLPLLRPDAEAFADVQQIYGLRSSRARALPLPNRNVVEAGSISFTGRRRMADATYSLGGECVRLRGAADTNDVSLTICWAAYVQDLGTVRPEVQKMIASAARSI